MTLHELVFIDDALNAIGQHQDLDNFVLVHDVQHQWLARQVYLKAVELIKTHETRHKAIDFIQQEINKYR